jgi:hypothetical protein
MSAINTSGDLCACLNAARSAPAQLRRGAGWGMSNGSRPVLCCVFVCGHLTGRALVAQGAACPVSGRSEQHVADSLRLALTCAVMIQQNLRACKRPHAHMCTFHAIRMYNDEHLCQSNRTRQTTRWVPLLLPHASRNWLCSQICHSSCRSQ